jgi:D-alanyl-D-alanine carboxypeptidase (penicillin-binding protein 5/6)
MRLVAVLLGVPGDSLSDGARNRAIDGMRLLSYGFGNFATTVLEPPRLDAVRVWKGVSRELAIAPAGPLRLTATSVEKENLCLSVAIPRPVLAPVARGQVVGDLLYVSGGQEIGRIPLVAVADVKSAGILRRAWDSVLLGVSSIGLTGRSSESAPRATLSPHPAIESGKGG